MNKEEIKQVVEHVFKVSALAMDDYPYVNGNEPVFRFHVPLDDGQDQVGVIKVENADITLVAQFEDSVNDIAWEEIKKVGWNPMSIHYKKLYREEE